MVWIMVDVETDGPCPGLYSMISLGAVIVEPGLTRTFYGQFRPISDRWQAEALAVSGHTREECMAFPDAQTTMEMFQQWILNNCRRKKFRGNDVPDARFIADNNGFDWQFVNYYAHRFLGENPFGFSSTNLGSLYKGMARDVFQSFKHLRKTAHTHHPVDDAKGNAEAFLAMRDMGLAVSWE
jgi:hypothetical protein